MEHNRHHKGEALLRLVLQYGHIRKRMAPNDVHSQQCKPKSDLPLGVLLLDQSKSLGDDNGKKAASTHHVHLRLSLHQLMMMMKKS